MIDASNRNLELEHFLQALKAKDWLTRKCAADDLGKLGDASVVPNLIEVMKD